MSDSVIFSLQVRKSLLSNEALSYEELEELIGPRPEGRKLSKDDWRFEN